MRVCPALSPPFPTILRSTPPSHFLLACLLRRHVGRHAGHHAGDVGVVLLAHIARRGAQLQRIVGDGWLCSPAAAPPLLLQRDLGTAPHTTPGGSTRRAHAQQAGEPAGAAGLQWWRGDGRGGLSGFAILPLRHLPDCFCFCSGWLCGQAAAAVLGAVFAGGRWLQQYLLGDATEGGPEVQLGGLAEAAGGAQLHLAAGGADVAVEQRRRRQGHHHWGGNGAAGQAHQTPAARLAHQRASTARRRGGSGVWAGVLRKRIRSGGWNAWDASNQHRHPTRPPTRPPTWRC